MVISHLYIPSPNCAETVFPVSVQLKLPDNCPNSYINPAPPSANCISISSASMKMVTSDFFTLFSYMTYLYDCTSHLPIIASSRGSSFSHDVSREVSMTIEARGREYS